MYMDAGRPVTLRLASPAYYKRHNK